MPDGLASKVGCRAWTKSVQGAIATWSVTSMRCPNDFESNLDQVAIAPCTDFVQE